MSVAGHSVIVIRGSPVPMGGAGLREATWVARVGVSRHRFERRRVAAESGQKKLYKLRATNSALPAL